MSVRTLLTASALLLHLLAAASDQSTCKAAWLFKCPCTQPAIALVSQVKAWSTQKCKGNQEQCMYELLKESPTYLEIRHTSPSTRKTTEITFAFTPPEAPNFCKIRSLSTTRSGNGTSPNDYCLLYNLIYGSGLTNAEGYREICNDAMCPSKKSATCNNE